VGFAISAPEPLKSIDGLTSSIGSTQSFKPKLPTTDGALTVEEVPVPADNALKLDLLHSLMGKVQEVAGSLKKVLPTDAALIEETAEQQPVEWVAPTFIETEDAMEDEQTEEPKLRFKRRTL